MMKSKIIILVALMCSAPAFADDKDDAPVLRERINCFPAKNITKMVAKFQSLDAHKRDTVDMLFEAKFDVQDGGVLPERIFLRDNGFEENFSFDAEGNVVDFGKIGSVSKTAELCSEDPSREGTSSEEGVNFRFSGDVHFLENSGYHNLAALKDGLKDGKSHYKKMVPAPLRMVVPKMTYVMIEYDNDDTRPQFTAMKEQVPTPGLDHEIFCGQPIIKIEDLETLGANGLKVMGGNYNLSPVPGPKALAKFVTCTEDEDESQASEVANEADPTE